MAPVVDAEEVIGMSRPWISHRNLFRLNVSIQGLLCVQTNRLSPAANGITAKIRQLFSMECICIGL